VRQPLVIIIQERFVPLTILNTVRLTYSIVSSGMVYRVLLVNSCSLHQAAALLRA